RSPPGPQRQPQPAAARRDRRRVRRGLLRRDHVGAAPWDAHRPPARALGPGRPARPAARGGGRAAPHRPRPRAAAHQRREMAGGLAGLLRPAPGAGRARAAAGDPARVERALPGRAHRGRRMAREGPPRVPHVSRTRLRGRGLRPHRGERPPPPAVRLEEMSWRWFIAVAAGIGAAVPGAAPTDAARSITVASYYFGNYHPGDPRNVKMKGAGWSEWELVKAARPRFPGHPQPKVPQWGYGDESDPRVMAQKIAAAADHGIDAFIFDWYYYDDGPFLDRPIDVGFLQAKNNRRLKFALMWANHDWQEIQPYKRGAPPKLLFPGKVTQATFERLCDHVIKDYFLHPSYWRIDGRPYFSFYDLSKLLDNFGSVEATRAALDQ